MKRAARALMLAVCVAAAAWTHAGAQPPDDDAFVRDVIDAINSGDFDRRRPLIHPAARGCAEALARAPLEQGGRRQASTQIGEDRRWSIRPLNRAPIAASDKAAWPVSPTHTLQIGYQTDARKRRTLILHIVADQGRWYEVFACPKPGAFTPR